MEKVKTTLSFLCVLAMIWGLIWGIFDKGGLALAAWGISLGLIICKSEESDKKEEEEKEWF